MRFFSLYRVDLNPPDRIRGFRGSATPDFHTTIRLSCLSIYCSRVSQPALTVNIRPTGRPAMLPGCAMTPGHWRKSGNCIRWACHISTAYLARSIAGLCYSLSICLILVNKSPSEFLVIHRHNQVNKGRQYRECLLVFTKQWHPSPVKHQKLVPLGQYGSDAHSRRQYRGVVLLCHGVPAPCTRLI